MAKYDLRQQVFCMNWMAGIANRQKNIQKNLQWDASQHMRAVLADRKVKELIGEWQVAWGPAVYQAIPNSPLTPGSDHCMFVAKTEPNIYVISVAGSNAQESILVDGLLESVQTEITVPWPYATAENTPSIALGTYIGVEILLTNSQMESKGGKLLTFLHSISQQPIELHVTGSSLGGALSATLALALFDQKNKWDPNGNATMKVLTVAGATPGDTNFASYYDSKLGNCTERVWNQKDIVPHFWELDMMAQIPDLYSPKIESNELIQDLVADLRGWSSLAQGNYQQICKQTPGFPGTVNTERKVLDGPLTQVSQILANLLLKKFAGSKKPASLLVSALTNIIEVILKKIINCDPAQLVDLKQDLYQEIVEPHLQTIEDHLQQHKGHLSPGELKISSWLPDAITWLHSNLPGFLHFFGELEYQHIDAYLKHMKIMEFDKRYLEIRGETLANQGIENINAVVLWNNGKAYFFSGSNYSSYDVASDQADLKNPFPIMGHLHWPGWPGNFSDIDAAVLWNNSKAYFFKDDHYISYDLTIKHVDWWYPKKIVANWSGWPENFTNIDAGVVWNNGKAYFFKGDEYIRYDLSNDSVDSGYPKKIVSNWSGWPENFTDIDAGVVWNNGKAYFFKGDEYIRYDLSNDSVDAGYPKKITVNWPGLLKG